MSRVGGSPIGGPVVPGGVTGVGGSPITPVGPGITGEEEESASATGIFVFGPFDQMGRPSGRRTTVLNDDIMMSGK